MDRGQFNNLTHPFPNSTLALYVQEEVTIPAGTSLRVRIYRSNNIKDCGYGRPQNTDNDFFLMWTNASATGQQQQIVGDRAMAAQKSRDCRLLRLLPAEVPAGPARGGRWTARSSSAPRGPRWGSMPLSETDGGHVAQTMAVLRGRPLSKSSEIAPTHSTPSSSVASMAWRGRDEFSTVKFPTQACPGTCASRKVESAVRHGFTGDDHTVLEHAGVGLEHDDGSWPALPMHHLARAKEACLYEGMSSYGDDHTKRSTHGRVGLEHDRWAAPARLVVARLRAQRSAYSRLRFPRSADWSTSRGRVGAKKGARRAWPPGSGTRTRTTRGTTRRRRRSDHRDQRRTR